jgi:hypothetical protein
MPEKLGTVKYLANAMFQEDLTFKIITAVFACKLVSFYLNSEIRQTHRISLVSGCPYFF